LPAEEWVECMPIHASVRSAGSLAATIGPTASVLTAGNKGKGFAHVRFIPVIAVTSKLSESP